MYRLGKYTKDDNMSKLISDNYKMLLVVSRFGISLGFGEKSIGEVCDENNVDVPTFLAVVNMLQDEDTATDYSNVSVEDLMTYLHNSHDYFLGFRLPRIREKLVAIVGKKDNLSKAIIKYFDEYIAEVNKHMAYEEKTVFPYVRALLDHKEHEKYNIDMFSRQHDQVELRLIEFKNIIIKYYPSKSTNELNSVLFDIFNCEEDLASHNAIEDRIFTPAIARLEANNN